MSISTSNNVGCRSDVVLRAGMVLLAIATTFLLCYRMTIGVDLTDESYYLSFLDGWLKTGFQDSNALVLHQTAELLIFPLVKIFAALMPNDQGLALFNRFIYLVASLISGFCFFRFARTRQTFPVAVLCGMAVTSFIPFSLPSPSYNTLGMLSMLSAVAAFATYAQTHQPRWLITSAAAWMVSVLAYPTFVAVLASFLVAIAVVPVLRPNLRRYFVWCLIFQVLGLVLLLSTYGVGRLMQIIEFTNASLQISTGLGGKLSKAAALLGASKIFVSLCLASIAVGIFAGRDTRNSFHGWIISAAITGILVTDLLAGPFLYATSHDYVFLLAIAGTAFFLTATITKARNDLAMTAYFFVGLFAGIVTSTTATNSIVNFAVGGFICVCMFILAIFPKGEVERHSHPALLSVVVALLLMSNFNFIYGEGVNPLSSASAKRIESGVFAGLLTTEDKARAIIDTTTFLATIPGDSVAVIGRFPSIYLLTGMRPKTLSTWDFSQQNGATPKIDRAISKFYGLEANLPSVVLNVTDPWTAAPSESGKQLQERYIRASHIDTNQWSIEVLVRPPLMK
ncbi:hypothetical protein M5G20_22420 [Pseudomonas sp. TNT2022 ID1044]|uniref:hypothetical protein n=1 Tax=Pseudomonas sp. TNT2022 ID1044 TaxID=2942636 RepID=UPI00236233FF|nr:hypothetical protein [Pseudomonas sp. TNT2022 ID1044]MDD0998599.1 hypothetical protein [Pseudomonas sp. TNT2022 ID1044]